MASSDVYGEEQFGVKEWRNSKATSTPAKSRKQQEIERLVRETAEEAVEEGL